MDLEKIDTDLTSLENSLEQIDSSLLDNPASPKLKEVTTLVKNIFDYLVTILQELDSGDWLTVIPTNSLIISGILISLCLVFATDKTFYAFIALIAINFGIWYYKKREISKVKSEIRLRLHRLSIVMETTISEASQMHVGGKKGQAEITDLIDRIRKFTSDCVT